MWGETDLKLDENLYSREELEKYQENFQSSEPIENTEKDITFDSDASELVILYPFKAKSHENLDAVKYTDSCSTLKLKVRDDFEKMSPEDIGALCYIRRKFPAIERIEIRIEDSKISDENLLDLLSCIFWKNDSLRNINFSYVKEGLFEKSILFFANSVLPSAKHLSEITIAFTNCEVTKKAWDSLSHSVTQLAENFTSFHFVVNCKDADASSFQTLFSRMPNLEFFAYQVNGKAFDDQALEEFISRTLPSLKNLTNFQLFIDDSTVTDSSVRKLFASFPEDWFLQLWQFRVGLANTKITDESLEEFIDVNLAKFKTLNDFGVYSNKLSSYMQNKLSKLEKELATNQ